MKKLHIDLETYSETPLRVVGHYRYARHPSTEILMAAFTIDNAEPICISLYPRKPIPPKLAAALTSPKYLKIAHNASFEFEMLTHVAGLELDLSQWQCSMVMAYYASLPGSLDMACKAVELPFDKQKDKEGQKQIHWFCKPRKPSRNKPWTRNTPETSFDRWRLFMEYCKQDVVSERALVNRLRSIGIKVPEQEWELWRLDQEINRIGLPIDRGIVHGARTMARMHTDTLIEEAKELTGMDNPNSINQLKEWLAEHGLPTETVNKDWVSEQLGEGVRHIPTWSEL